MVLKRTQSNKIQMELIDKTIAYVQSEMASNDSSHDWNHIDRVRKLARFIAIKEGLTELQQFEAELAALLHDIKDWKYSGSSIAGEQAAREFLEQNQVDPEIITVISYVVAHIGFSKELTGLKAQSNLHMDQVLAVVQDADRLDALGAIGIARALTFGGAQNRILYDPNLPPRDHFTEKEYKYGQSTTINHFYEKLLKLPAMMKTATGRQIAEKRGKFMEDYIEQFQMEWQGKDFTF